MVISGKYVLKCPIFFCYIVRTELHIVANFCWLIYDFFFPFDTFIPVFVCSHSAKESVWMGHAGNWWILFTLPSFFGKHVQYHQLFRHKDTHTLDVSEMQVLLWPDWESCWWNVHWCSFGCFHGGVDQCKERQLFMSISYGFPESSAEQYWPNLHPTGTILCHFSLQVDCHTLLCKLLQTKNASYQDTELRLISASLLEINTCNQKKMIQWMVRTLDLALNDVSDTSWGTLQFGHSSPRDVAHLPFYWSQAILCIL